METNTVTTTQAYLIEVGDQDKHAVLNPRVIGPFESGEAASDFGFKLNLGNDCYGQGGYSTFVVICEELSQSPLDHVKEYLESYGVGESQYFDGGDYREITQADHDAILDGARRWFGDAVADELRDWYNRTDDE